MSYLFTILKREHFICFFQKKGSTYYIGGCFLLVFIAIGAFIFANLVVAVVVTNLECAVVDVKKEEEEIAKELDLKGKLNKEQEEAADIVKDDDIPSMVFKKQEPLFVPVSITLILFAER